MKTNIIRSGDRGFFDHGWLKTFHTFSFADYYNADRINFGALRVLNDDQVLPGYGFGMHSHSNMEIITIPLSGQLEHEDTTGQKGIIIPDEVQVMSAGTGIYHSEKNAGKEMVSFLQIWIIPREKSINPRYDQRSFDRNEALDNNQLLVSNDGRDKSLKIFQNAYITRRFSSTNKTYTYNQYLKSNGIFIFVIDGGANIGESDLTKRDSIMILPQESLITITPDLNSHILFIEVPVH